MDFLHFCTSFGKRHCLFPDYLFQKINLEDRDSVPTGAKVG